MTSEQMRITNYVEIARNKCRLMAIINENTAKACCDLDMSETNKLVEAINNNAVISEMYGETLRRIDGALSKIEDIIYKKK